MRTGDEVILFLNAGSYPRPGLHQLRAGPRQLPAGGQDRAGLRRPALADPIVERGARSGAAAFRRPSTRVRRTARHSARAAAARWLPPPANQLPAVAGAGDGDVAPLSELGHQGDSGGLPGVGHSGLVYGLVSYIFVAGVIRRDRRAIAASLLVFFLYGSMLWGVFPIQPGVSW